MEGHLVQRGKSRVWWLVFDVPKVRGERRRQRWVRIGRGTRSEAVRRKRETLREFDKGNWHENRDLTVGELLTLWLRDNEHRLQARTHEGYVSKVQCHLAPSLGSILVSRLKPTHVIQAYATARSKGLSGQSCVHLHRILHTAMHYGMKTLRVVGENIMDAVPAPKPDTREPQGLNEDHVRMIIEAARGTRLEVPVIVTAITGLRRSELLALQWSISIDLDRRVIAVMRALEQTRKHGVRLKDTKSRSSRRQIPIPSALVDVLRLHQIRQKANRSGACQSSNGLDLVFCNEDGSFWPPDSFTAAYSRVARLVGLQGRLRFHDLRHAFASLLLRNGTSVKEVSVLLGHSSGTLTLSTYAHSMEGMGREAVEKLSHSLLKPGQVA